MKHFILTLTFALFLNACGSDNSGNSEEPRTDSPKSGTINGMAAEEFYKQFTYTKNDQNKHRYLEAPSYLFFLKLNSSGTERAFVQLKLLENKTFKAQYIEVNNFAFISGGVSYNTRSTDSISGSWKVDGTSLILEGLGTGTGLSYNEKPAITLKLEKNFRSSGVAGSVTTLQASWWNTETF